MTDDEGNGGSDSTRAGGMRPPPRLPATPPAKAPATSGGENTGVGGAPPPPLPARPAPPAVPEVTKQAAPEAPSPPEPPEIIDDGTQVYVRPKVTLTRLGPPGHSGVIPLASGPYRIGRSSQCDILLYAPASSRVNAHLRLEERGWILEPEPGKLVAVDGETIAAATLLGQKAHLRLGGDDLLFLDESRAASPASIAPAPAPRTRFSARLWLIVAAAVVAIAALLRFVLGP